MPLVLSRLMLSSDILARVYDNQDKMEKYEEMLSLC